jgi:hypothetical protein
MKAFAAFPSLSAAILFSLCVLHASPSAACATELLAQTFPHHAPFPTVPANAQLWFRASPFNPDSPDPPTFYEGDRANLLELPSAYVANGVFRAIPKNAGVAEWTIDFDPERGSFTASGTTTLRNDGPVDLTPPTFAGATTRLDAYGHHHPDDDTVPGYLRITYTYESLPECGQLGSKVLVTIPRASDDVAVLGYVVSQTRGGQGPTIPLIAFASRSFPVGDDPPAIELQNVENESRDLLPTEKLAFEVVAFDIAGNLSEDAIHFVVEAGWGSLDANADIVRVGSFGPRVLRSDLFGPIAGQSAPTEQPKKSDDVSDDEDAVGCGALLTGAPDPLPGFALLLALVAGRRLTLAPRGGASSSPTL